MEVVMLPGARERHRRQLGPLDRRAVLAVFRAIIRESPGRAGTWPS